jgi:hypothetical protein
MVQNWEDQVVRVLEEPEAASNRELAWVWSCALQAGNVLVLERLAQVRRAGLDFERVAKAADLLALHHRDEALFAVCSQHLDVLKDVSRSRTLPALLAYCAGSRAVGLDSSVVLATLEHTMAVISENTLALDEIPSEIWIACMMNAVDAKAPEVLHLLRSAPLKQLHDPMFLAEMILRAYRQRDEATAPDPEAFDDVLIVERRLVDELVAAPSPALVFHGIGVMLSAMHDRSDAGAEESLVSEFHFLANVLEALACIQCPVSPGLLHWFIELRMDIAADWLFANCEFDVKSLPYSEFSTVTRRWLWNKGIACQKPILLDGIIRAFAQDREGVRNDQERSLEQLAHFDAPATAADLLADAGYDVSLLILFEAVSNYRDSKQEDLEKRVTGDTLLRLLELALVSRALHFVYAICAELCARAGVTHDATSIDRERLRLACIQALRWAALHGQPDAVAMIRSFDFEAAHDSQLLGSLCCECFQQLTTTAKNEHMDQEQIQKDRNAASVVRELVQEPPRCLARKPSTVARTDARPNEDSFDRGLLRALEMSQVDQVALLRWAAGHSIVRLSRLLLKNQQTALLQCAERGEPHLLRILLGTERKQLLYQKTPLLWTLTLQEALCRIIPTRNLTSVHLLIEQPSIHTGTSEQTSTQILASLGDAETFQLLSIAAEQGDDTLVRLLLLAHKQRMTNLSQLSVIVANAARAGQFPILFTLHRLLEDMPFMTSSDQHPPDRQQLGMRLFGNLGEEDLRELARLATIHGEFAVFENAIKLFFREFAIDPSRRYELLMDLLRIAVHHGQAPLVEFICQNYPAVLYHSPEICIGQNTVLIYHNRMEERLSRDVSAALLAALLNSRPSVVPSSRTDLMVQTSATAATNKAEKDRTLGANDRGATPLHRERQRTDASGNQHSVAAPLMRTASITETFPSPAAFFPRAQPPLAGDRATTPAIDEGTPFVRITTSACDGVVASPSHGAARDDIAQTSIDVNAAPDSSARSSRASPSQPWPRDSSHDTTAPAYLLRGLHSIAHPMLLQLLNWSVRERFAILLQLLLQLGLAISRENLNELLLCAVDGNDLNTMDAFLEAVTRSLRSADVNSVILDPEAQILTRALVLGNAEMALRLLRLNASLAVYRRKLSSTERGQLLLLAAAEAHAELTKITIHALGVDVNVTDKDGLTPLQLALRPLRQEFTASRTADHERQFHGQRTQVVIELILQGAGLEVLDETDLYNVFRLVSHSNESFMFVLTRFTELPDQQGCVRGLVRGDTGLRILRETIALLHPVVLLEADQQRAGDTVDRTPLQDQQRSLAYGLDVGDAFQSLPASNAALVEQRARGAYAVARFLAMYEDSLLHRLSLAEQCRFLFAAVAAGDRAAVQKLRVCLFRDAFDPTIWRDVHGRTLLDVAASLPDPHVAEAVMVALTEQLGATPFVEIYVESLEANMASANPARVDASSADVSSASMLGSVELTAAEQTSLSAITSTRNQAIGPESTSVQNVAARPTTASVRNSARTSAQEASLVAAPEPVFEQGELATVRVQVERSSTGRPHRSMFSDSDWDSDLDNGPPQELPGLQPASTDTRVQDRKPPLNESLDPSLVTTIASKESIRQPAEKALSMPQSPRSLTASESRAMHQTQTYVRKAALMEATATPATPAIPALSATKEASIGHSGASQSLRDQGAPVKMLSESTASPSAVSETDPSLDREAGPTKPEFSATSTTYTVQELPKRTSPTEPRPLPSANDYSPVSVELKEPIQDPELARIAVAMTFSEETARKRSPSMQRQAPQRQHRHRLRYFCCGLSD